MQRSLTLLILLGLLAACGGEEGGSDEQTGGEADVTDASDDQGAEDADTDNDGQADAADSDDNDTDEDIGDSDEDLGADGAGGDLDDAGEDAGDIPDDATGDGDVTDATDASDAVDAVDGGEDASDTAEEITFDTGDDIFVDSGPPPSCDETDLSDICASVCRGLRLCVGDENEACQTGCEANLTSCTPAEKLAICTCIETQLTCSTYQLWNNCMGEIECVRDSF